MRIDLVRVDLVAIDLMAPSQMNDPLAIPVLQDTFHAP